MSFTFITSATLPRFVRPIHNMQTCHLKILKCFEGIGKRFPQKKPPIVPFCGKNPVMYDVQIRWEIQASSNFVYITVCLNVFPLEIRHPILSDFYKRKVVQFYLIAKKLLTCTHRFFINLERYLAAFIKCASIGGWELFFFIDTIHLNMRWVFFLLLAGLSKRKYRYSQILKCRKSKRICE